MAICISTMKQARSPGIIRGPLVRDDKKANQTPGYGAFALLDTVYNVTTMTYSDAGSQLRLDFTYNPRNQVTDVKRYTDTAAATLKARRPTATPTRAAPRRSRTRTRVARRSIVSTIITTPPVGSIKKRPLSDPPRTIVMTRPASSPATARIPIRGTPMATARTRVSRRRPEIS